MEYQQARQAEVSARMPEQAADRQLKSITDNRPEAAAQRRLMEGMARGTEVAQRMCGVTQKTQTDCNCGLTCVRMAIKALGGTKSKEDYDNAAEAAGSNVGEIFSFDVMKKIVNYLGYTCQQKDFGGYANPTLDVQLGATGTNPVLIAFSNLAYLVAYRNTSKIGGSQAHTQRGHWAVVEGLSMVGGAIVLKIANPNGFKSDISLGNMSEANQAMDGVYNPTINYTSQRTLIPKAKTVGIQSVLAPGGGPQFDWGSFVPGAYQGMGERVYVLEDDGLGIMKRTVVKDGTGLFSWNALETEMQQNPKSPAGIAAAIKTFLAEAKVLNRIYSAATDNFGAVNPGVQSKSAVNRGISKQQDLDLSGYIVEIS